MGWLAFAPIPGPTTEYFGISTNQVDLFSVLFMLVGIPVGLVAIWCVDIIGRDISIMRISRLLIRAEKINLDRCELQSRRICCQTIDLISRGAGRGGQLPRRAEMVLPRRSSWNCHYGG